MTYVRVCSSVIPGLSVIMAWILIYVGKAADYDSGDVVMDKNEGGEDEEIN